MIFWYSYCDCGYKTSVKPKSGKCHCGKLMIDVYKPEEENGNTV